MRLAQKMLSVITLSSLLLSTNYQMAFCAPLPAAPAPLSTSEESLALPDAKVGVEYEYLFQSEGGLAPLNWRIAQGDLPPGIKLESNGRLYGLPLQAQRDAYSFVVEVLDSSRAPQKVLQSFLLFVNAPPLQVKMPSLKLKILPPSGADATLALAAGPRVNEPRSFPDTSSVTPKVQRANTLIANVSPTLPNNAIKDLNKEDKTVADSDKKGFDPYTFIRIYEDTEGGKRTLIYDPEYARKQDLGGLSANEQSRSITKLSADKNSKLVIVPATELMDDDMPLNNLYMTAKLASGDTSSDVEIEGYAKIGKSLSGGQTQRGTSFQSVRDIQTKLLTLAFAADDILDNFYGEDPEQDEECLTGEVNEKRKKNHKKLDGQFAVAATKDPAKLADDEKASLNKLKSQFLLYAPEINSISDFLLEGKNLSIIKIIGSEIFGIDSESVQQTAEQFKQSAQTAFNDKSTESARNQALLILFERTKLIHRIFENIKGQAVKSLFQGETNLRVEERSYCRLSPLDRQQKRRELYLNLGKAKRKDAVKELKKLIATGSISLTTAKAKDHDRLTLSIEARGVDGENLGIPANFEIEIKQFGPKLVISDSFMFIKRLGLTDNDIFTPPNGRGLKKVNFAPSPGITFGMSYFKRGESSFDKFLRAVSPGVGVNVSFMNYDDSGFDLVKQQFTNTNGVNVDVGVGVVGMLFNNNIQLSYGYNLNAEVKRRYFGVGFSFLKIADRLGKYIK